MTDIRETLNRISLRADMATPGPWEATCSDFGHSRTDSECAVITSDVGDKVCDLQSVDRLDLNERYRDEGVVDAAFIAMARTDVPLLVAALRAVLDFTTADKTPIWVGIALDEIITEALGGDA